MLDGELDAIAVDSITDISAHNGLEESLAARVGDDVVNFLEMPGTASGQDQCHVEFATAGRRGGDGIHVQMFNFIGDFAHGRQGDFGDNLSCKIAGRSGRRGASPKLERPGVAVGGSLLNDEPGLKMDGVSIEAVAVRFREPSERDRRVLR